MSLGIESALLRRRLGKLAFQGKLSLVDFGQRRGLLLQLVDSLLVEVAIGADLIDLAVEQLQYLGILDTKGAGTGGANPFSPGFHNPLPLIFELLVLIEQS